MNLLKYRKKVIKIFLIGFVLLNVIAFFHAYKFTHFTNDTVSKTKNPDQLTAFLKVKTLILGVNNPKPRNLKFPSQEFKVITLKSNKKIECWSIKCQNSKGTVVLFHGYGGEKSSMLDKSDEFIKLGYSTFLVDFMGSGNSEGSQTTIGFKEAEEVKTTFDYVAENGEKNIFLFGTSMGAVAIMKCLNDSNIKPKGIILECPFGTMYKTVCARFDNMNAPTFPMAGILLFWGGVQNGFWGFSHNPSEYAKSIKCPTLLLYGSCDKSVSRNEIDEIYKNLKGDKILNVYKKTGHENYLLKNKIEWVQNLSCFLN
jgi:alpha-beta hydrolase superfamily lysophospholipase